jgi:predicted membrane protein
MKILLNPFFWMALFLLFIFFPYWVGMLPIVVGIYLIDRWYQWYKRRFLNLDEDGYPLQSKNLGK